MAEASGLQEISVVASCPAVHHDAVQNICLKMKMVKAFGQEGDVVDDIPGHWVPKWRMRVVQAVTTSLQLHPECSTAKIYCIQGGKHCDAEMAAVPELNRAIEKEMSQMNRKVRTQLSWLSFEQFEEETSKMATEASSSSRGYPNARFQGCDDASQPKFLPEDEGLRTPSSWLSFTHVLTPTKFKTPTEASSWIPRILQGDEAIVLRFLVVGRRGVGRLTSTNLLIDLMEGKKNPGSGEVTLEMT
eukprot:Skav228180  [mRNA]  locus=scaffold3933:209731:210465:+ [translate_table: standard]